MEYLVLFDSQSRLFSTFLLLYTTKLTGEALVVAKVLLTSSMLQEMVQERPTELIPFPARKETVLSTTI